MSPEATTDFTFTEEEINDGKALAGIAYFGLIGFLIAFLAGGDKRFVLYHAQQGLILAIAFLLSPIPVLGWLIAIIALVLWIIGMINGFTGQVKPLPIVGGLGFKFHLLKD